jgi:DNA-binding NarL/FixJ family response regulator
VHDTLPKIRRLQKKTTHFILICKRKVTAEAVVCSLSSISATDCEVYATVTEFVARAKPGLAVDAVLFDSTPPYGDNLQALSDTIAAAERKPVGVLSDSLNVSFLETAMDYGASGVILTSMNPKSFTLALLRLAAGETCLPADYIKSLRSKTVQSTGEIR